MALAITARAIKHVYTLKQLVTPRVVAIAVRMLAIV